MRRSFTTLVASVAIAAVAWAGLADRAGAATSEPTDNPQIDPAPCVAAAAANDADGVIAVCGGLIDNVKTARPDRLKALIARAGAYDRKDMIDRAIDDYDTALRLDPTLADFAAAVKLNPRHEAARANHRSLALELERLGAQMAIKNKPGPAPK